MPALPISALYALAARSDADGALPDPSAPRPQHADLEIDGHPYRPGDTHGHRIYELADGGIMTVYTAGLSVVDRVEFTGPAARAFVPAYVPGHDEWVAATSGTHFLRVDLERMPSGASWVALRGGTSGYGPRLVLRPRDARDLAARLVAAAERAEADAPAERDAD